MVLWPMCLEMLESQQMIVHFTLLSITSIMVSIMIIQSMTREPSACSEAFHVTSICLVLCSLSCKKLGDSLQLYQDRLSNQHTLSIPRLDRDLCLQDVVMDGWFSRFSACHFHCGDYHGPCG